MTYVSLLPKRVVGNHQYMSASAMVRNKGVWELWSKGKGKGKKRRTEGRKGKGKKKLMPQIDLDGHGRPPHFPSHI